MPEYQTYIGDITRMRDRALQDIQTLDTYKNLPCAEESVHAIDNLVDYVKSLNACIVDLSTTHEAPEKAPEGDDTEKKVSTGDDGESVTTG